MRIQRHYRENTERNKRKYREYREKWWEYRDTTERIQRETRENTERDTTERYGEICTQIESPALKENSPEKAPKQKP